MSVFRTHPAAPPMRVCGLLHCRQPDGVPAASPLFVVSNWWSPLQHPWFLLQELNLYCIWTLKQQLFAQNSVSKNHWTEDLTWAVSTQCGVCVCSLRVQQTIRSGRRLVTSACFCSWIVNWRYAYVTWATRCLWDWASRSVVHAHTQTNDWDWYCSGWHGLKNKTVGTIWHAAPGDRNVRHFS
jgi:hypothetical protein